MKRLLASLPATVYAGAIAFLSHLPGLTVPAYLPWADKLSHTLLYSGFGITLALALTALFLHRTFRVVALWTLLLGALYAASDEFHQLFVPHRVADVADWAADVFGVLLGVLLSRPLFPRWQRWLRIA